MFLSNDVRHMTLGQLISLCFDELSERYSNTEELNMAVASRLEVLLSEYEAEVL